MPKKPHTKNKQSANVSEESVDNSTSEESLEPTPAPTPANAENRKKLLTQLEHHSKFVRAMGWALGILGLYFMGSTFYALSQSVLLKPVWSLIAGTSTSPGIPVAAAQAILPAFMAPYAVYVVIGVPLALWGYQFAFEYLNKHLFEPKVTVTQRPSDTPDNSKTPDNEVENKSKTKTDNKPPKATSTQVQKQADKKAAASNKSDAKKSASAKRVADKGHGKVISHAFNQHKRKAQETKQKAAQTKQVKATEKAAPAKRKTANRQ